MAKSYLVPDTAYPSTSTACLTTPASGQYAWMQATGDGAASINVYNSDDNYAAKLLWSFVAGGSTWSSPMYGPYKLRSGSGVHVKIAGTGASVVVFTAS